MLKQSCRVSFLTKKLIANICYYMIYILKYHKREYIIKINMEQNYKFGIFDPMAKVFYYIPVSNS